MTEQASVSITLICLYLVKALFTELYMEAVTINVKWCKGCGICVAFCPKNALALEREKATLIPDRCIACGMCELYCPDLAISVDKTKRPKKSASEVPS